jgi:type IV fimbrial biogenesis protein FimT
MNAQVTQFGFTMIELLIVITIAALLVAIGVPSYRYVTTANRVAGEINNLLGDLQFARYEALKEGLNVTLCPTASATATTCFASSTWTGGWIVLSSPNAVNASAVLRRQLPFTQVNSKDTLTSNGGVQSLIFNREGFVTGLAGTLTFSLQDPTGTAAYTRCLMVSLAGAAATTKSGGIVFTATC